MSKLASSGKTGIFVYLIYPSDRSGLKHISEYNATVTTPSEIFETKIHGFEAASIWVERTIKKLKEIENYYESERYY